MIRRLVPGIVLISFVGVASAGKDVGIYPDLDDQVRIDLPQGLKTDQVSLVVDERHGLVVLYADGRAVKVYVDAKDPELAPFAKAPTTRLGKKQKTPGDRDDDGIPDALDVLVGAKKLVVNAASYDGGYYQISYPDGDAPRDRGSCADVVVRALRNAGWDLQREIQEDIRRAPKAYPMVKKRDPNIDHRRVRTMLPWFQRHAAAHGTDYTDASDPFLPGDIVFLDTFPNKAGPDHVGIVSDLVNDDGVPLIINNWTNGTVDAEMDLLPYIPVVARYRLK